MENQSYCILAGGCFWCIAMPYYECKGVSRVISGYCGGEEINPTYEDVKAQKTSHREVIKIIYDSSIISFKELIEIYFANIDPFDGEGQFIDRGLSYSPAIFYKDENELNIAKECIKKIEKDNNKKVEVLLIKEKQFYDAEEYHQDYGLKNPSEIEKELIESGRKNK